MQMLCKVLAGFSDVRCPICGQGFSVYWTRSREITRTEQRESLQNVLRAQHTSTDSGDIHDAAFELPDIPVALPRRVPEGAGFPLAVPVYH